MEISCPIPISQYPHVLMAHGGGGKLMHNLIQKMFVGVFQPSDQHDSAVFSVSNGRMAFTTDSYVVKPMFFPGGDVGKLAVYGTVNDLAMSGARPLYLSLGLILEEGLPMQTLWEVVQSIQAAADHAGVKIITGDTKVVDKGKGDGVFINTAGVGVLEHDHPIAPSQIQAGDAILLSGDLGRHGVAIMAAREGLAFETTITSDCAPLAAPILNLIAAGVAPHCLRDLTRGGLASALVELALASGCGLHIEENAIPIAEEVRGACELLGLDPLHVACEGRFVAFVPPHQAEQAQEILGAVQIGRVLADSDGRVTLTSAIGATRIVDMLSGEQLPRIC